MGAGFYPLLRNILKTHGCSFVRQGKGSHEIWRSPINEKVFPVAESITSRHLANAILKQADIGQRM